MEDIDRQSAPAAPRPPLSPDAVLAEQLAQCHSAVSGCFEFCSHSDVSVSQQLEVFNAASRLMRVSVALAAALDKTPREFTHRVIVERPPILDVTPPAMRELVSAPEMSPGPLVEGPPPPMSKSKTIHGGGAERARNG
jgi:hypothetical protein